MTGLSKGHSWCEEQLLMLPSVRDHQSKVARKVARNVEMVGEAVDSAGEGTLEWDWGYRILSEYFLLLPHHF